MDDVYKTISAAGDDEAEKQAEGKKIIEQLGALKYEMLHDRQLTYVSKSPTSTTKRPNTNGSAI